MEEKNVFIGIDFSKKTFDVAVMDGKCRRFPNSEAGCDELLGWLGQDLGEGLSNCLFCCENTGSHSLLLADRLHLNGCTLWMENPLQIKRSVGLSRGKDDRTDAMQIARYAARNKADAVAYEPVSQHIADLRNLLSHRALLVSQCTALRNAATERKITDKGSACDGFLAQLSADRIQRLRHDIKEIEARMLQIIHGDERMDKHYSHIVSIKGVGLVNAAALIALTADFMKFPLDAGKLACHVGVAPFKYESGTSVRRGTHVSRLCNHNIKPLLTQAALSAVRHNPDIKAYYTRLIMRGKPSPLALNNVKNKLVHIIVGLIRKDEDYCLHYRPATRECNIN